MTHYYLSGPMSGYPDHNRPQFNLCAQLLRERGYDVCNPVEFDEAPDLPWSDYLRKDIRALMDCGGVITLPGWQESRGATLEVYVAHALGMQVLPFSLAVTIDPPKGEQVSVPATFDLVAHIRRARAFSERTFGPGERTAGVLAHIREELAEVEAAPNDLTEWIDVVILALDGAWRAGYEPEEIVVALAAKQTRNEARTWPDWRTQPTDAPIKKLREAPTC